jgi:ATP-binding cassette subfamily B (MDR/TAP) protein 10
MYLKTKFPVIMYRNFTSLVHNSRTKVFLHHRTIQLRNKTSMVNIPGVKKTEFRRLLSLAVPEKYRLAAAMGLLVISSAVTMAVPFALGKIIDIIYNLDQLKTSEQEAQKLAIKDRLQKVCLGLTGVFILGGLCNFGRVYLMRVSGQNITANLRNNIFSSIAKQETSFFDKNKTGELINRLSADSQLVSLTVTQQVRNCYTLRNLRNYEYFRHVSL